MTAGKDRFPDISDYGFLSDCHSAALVTRDGSIEWCCFGRFDAEPVFCRILDREKGGYFRLGPASWQRIERRYLPGTNVIETTFECDEGAVSVTDCLVVDGLLVPGTAAVHPRRQLIRMVRGLRGSVEVELDFAPRFTFGLVNPMLVPVDQDLVAAVGGADSLVLQTDLAQPAIENGRRCEARGRVSEGDVRFCSVTHAPSLNYKPIRYSVDQLRQAVDHTVEAWRGWLSGLEYEGKYRDVVERGALVLKGLTDAGAGAVIAAATTSLPEEIGGVRNWDYRYVWLRDSLYVLITLMGLGYQGEAGRFFRWLTRTTAGRADELQALYGIGGERLVFEHELDHLSGYRDSRPVRVGNGAFDQFQLDTYGELISTAAAWYRASGQPLKESVIDFLWSVIDVVAERWEEPDEGIWEVRGEPQHFLFSKVMAWLTFNRGADLARLAGDRELERARHQLAKRVRARIDAEGVDPATGAFVQALGSKSLDATALTMPIMGFVPFDDPRVTATINAVQAGLSKNGHVYRYVDRRDGLEGEEGTFFVCTTWMVVNLALTGRIEEAEALMDKLVACGNDLGLIAEEVDPDTGALLGNFPQAFSHIGMVWAAWAIDAARTGRPTPWTVLFTQPNAI